jgi:hypothetical protein
MATPAASGRNSGQAGNSAPSTPPELSFVIGSYLTIGLGMLVGWAIWKGVNPHDYKPAPGVSIFAALYIFAQSIERVLEPLSSFLDKTSAKLNKKAAVSALASAGDDEKFAKKAGLAQVRRNRGVILWAIASFLAMVAAGGLGVFLLKAIGLGSAPAAVDILVTGLAIGSGTKPLHDLIANIQKSSASKDASAATGQ